MQKFGSCLHEQCLINMAVIRKRAIDSQQWNDGEKSESGQRIAYK